MSALEKAEAALRGPLFDLDPGAPMAAAVLRARASARARAGGSQDPTPLLEQWSSFSRGSAAGDTRYFWPVDHSRVPLPPYSPPREQWRPWREADEQLQIDSREFESRLVTPLVVLESGELLLELAQMGNGQAQQLFDEVAPVFRREFARYIQSLHPWSDTFALWALVRHPLMLERLQPFALAIAVCYSATTAEEDPRRVCGRRYPFHRAPLASATSHLAYSLLRLGQDLELASELVEWLDGAGQSGRWGDGDSPADVLTTLACADLLSRIQPSFQCAPTVAFFEKIQRPDGTWSALGPDAPWLTSEIASWLRTSEQPFASRFLWPNVMSWQLDRKTGIAGYGWFEDLAAMFATVAGLRTSHCELAFIDLAGFRDFNSQHGQDAGDAVLAEIAQALNELGGTAVRDGGDEFLVVAAPTSTGLEEELEGFRKRWPVRFRKRFGSLSPVAPRIVMEHIPCSDLRASRQRLGEAIGPLKKRDPVPSPDGVLLRLQSPLR